MLKINNFKKKTKKQKNKKQKTKETVGIPMRTDSAQLFADLFLNSYKAEFMAYLTQKKEHR